MTKMDGEYKEKYLIKVCKIDQILKNDLHFFANFAKIQLLLTILCPKWSNYECMYSWK